MNSYRRKSLKSELPEKRGKREIETLYPPQEYQLFFSLFFFARIGRSDLTKKLEKVGPFECDELEKHCRVSAKCYPTRVPALYTMSKEKFKNLFLVLLLVSRQSKSQVLVINELVPIVLLLQCKTNVKFTLILH